MRMVLGIGLISLMGCDPTTSEPDKNTEPTVTDMVIVPSEGVTTSMELICVVTASDDDNDPLSLTYEWTLSDGTVLGNADVLQLTPAMVQPTDEIACTATVDDGQDSVTSSRSVQIENTEPTLASVSISPEEPLVDSLLECSFDAEDLDGEELTVSYSWTQNGTEVGTEASLQIDAENFSDDDVIACTVTVEDGYEGTASDSAEVVIGNTAPVIGSTTITPENPYSYETLTCTANDVTDLEGDEVTISYEWSIDGEIQTETSDMLTGPFLVGALIACRTTPNDGKVDGDSSDTDTTINNTAPTLDTVSISPMVNIEADTFMTCEATASDVDNEELTITYAWTKSDGTVLGTEGELQLDATMVSPGDSIACTATVTDPHGASDSQGGSVSVINTDPVVDSAAEITGDATTTSTLTCAATFSDLNDGMLTPTYSWTNQSGTELSTTDSYTIAASETDTGDELTCTASVEDADGATLSSASMVTISNTLPTLTGVTLSPDPVISTDSLTCSVDSTADIDEDAVTVLYEWSVDGVLQSETSDTLVGPLLVGTSVRCSVTPNDGKEDGATEFTELVVSNIAPVVDAVSLDAGPIYTDGTVTATVALSDIDAEQTVTANYAWHVIDASNGGTDTEVQNGTDNTLDGSFFDKDDQVYVVVTPHDGVESGNFVASTAVTIQNSAPTGITASVTSSDMFYNDSTLTCVATASDIDPEDAVLTYTYAWSTGATGADLVLDGSMMPGAEVTCTATATDGSGASISTNVMESLTNRAPTVDSVTLPQDVTAETTSILCDAIGSDLDGETPTLTYAWTVGGVVHSETSDTLTDTFVYGETIECTVTSADAMETGSSMTATTTVLNTLPVVSSVVLGPDPAYTDTSFAVTSLLSDVDTAQSGTLTASYQWYADGQPVGSDSASLSNGTMNEFFAKGQDVYVVVTPHDGVESGTPVQSNTVSVLNTAPTAPTVSISANNAPAEVGVDDLTCTIDVEASDIDGDAVTYDYTWYDADGNWAAETLATTALSDVYPGMGTDVGTWTCEVVANDGTVESSVANNFYEVDAACGDSSLSAWTCGDDLMANGDVYTRYNYGSMTLSGTLDQISGSSYLAPTCTDQIYRFNDATGQQLRTYPVSKLSCDGTYFFKLVGRVNQQFQRGVGFGVYFGDPDVSTTPRVSISRWVWNSAREAGSDVRFTDASTNYSQRLDWWNMTSSNEWFELVLDIDTTTNSCHAYFNSATHYREDYFTCNLPSNVAPELIIGGSAPMPDRGGNPNSDFIGVFASPPLEF